MARTLFLTALGLTLAAAAAAPTCVPKAESLSKLDAARKQLNAALVDNKTPRGCPGLGQTGLVTSAGTRAQIDSIFAQLHVLRSELHSKLPVTIFYWGDEFHTDLVGLFQEHFENVKLEDMSALPLPASVPHRCPEDKLGSPFALKALAIYHSASKYEHVLWMDSDNLPLVDPAQLFTTEEYQQKGDMFWPDLWNEGFVSPEIYDVLTEGAVSPSKVADSETGQILINTCRHQDVLEYALLLNEHFEVTYQYMLGDKDTFRLAYALAGKLDDFYQVPTPPASAYTTFKESKELQRMHSEFAVEHADATLYTGKCKSHPALAVGMVQHSPKGDLVFQHRSTSAMSLEHEDQVLTTVVGAPLAPKRAKELLFQVPGGGPWATCPENHTAAAWMPAPKTVMQVERAASAALNKLRNVDLSQFSYDKVAPGGPSETDVAMRLTRRMLQDVSYWANMTNTTTTTTTTTTTIWCPPGCKPWNMRRSLAASARQLLFGAFPIDCPEYCVPI
jgi:hypothetical protein